MSTSPEAEGSLRSWGGFTNFAISFSIISILAGCFTNFFAAWNNGGPVMVSIGLAGRPNGLINSCPPKRALRTIGHPATGD